MRFSPSCTGNTAVRYHGQPLTLFLPPSPLAVAWLGNTSMWSRCLTCPEVFVNLAMKMEARNIAQRYVILCVCVLNSVTLPPQHMENFSRPLEMTQCQKHKTFAVTKCFLKAEPLLKMSSAADDHQQNGQVTIKHG